MTVHGREMICICATGVLAKEASRGMCLVLLEMHEMNGMLVCHQ